MSRVYNFSAGPAVLPEEVLKQAASEMLDYQGCGMSINEMSHRSKTFDNVIQTAEQDIRDLMNIPDNYKVLLNLDSTESVKSSVIRGHGLSFVPYISVKKELYNKQLKEIKVTGFEMSYDIYIIYKKNKDMNKSAKEFIAFLKKIGEKSFC